LQGISFVPALVQGIEGLFGNRSGAEKKDAALSFVSAALSLTDAVTSRQIVDEAKFKDGLGKIIADAETIAAVEAWKQQVGV